MTSPNFKVLVNALQLGQPPDVASIRAVVEQLLVQQEEIAELRRQVAMLHNRMAALTLTAEPEMGGPGPSRSPSVAETGPVAIRPPSSRPPQSHYEQQPQQQGYAESGYPEVPGSGPSPGSGPYAEHPSSSARGARAARSPVVSPVVDEAEPGQLRSDKRRNPKTLASPRGEAASARNVPSVVEDFESAEFEDFHGTVVIRGEQEELRRRTEDAPFPIAPAGSPQRHASEIPGAPWAREQAEPAPMTSRRAPGPDIYDTYTIDSPERSPYPSEGAEAPPRVETDFEEDGDALQRRHRRRDRR